MTGTFISYRREDAAGYAGRLRESLERRLGAARVFRDVDTLRPGQDFVQAIEARLVECRVMLAVIGREWVDARDAAGARRLDEPYDFVRLEIAAALARPEVLVVPVLVEGAAMPAASELPENIRPLARRHAVSVRDETWDADVDRLVGVINSAEAGGGAARRLSLPRFRVWAAALAVLALVTVLVLTQMRGGSPQAGESGTPGSGAASAADTTAPEASGPAFAPYTIDIPRIAEAAFGDLIYSLVSGNMASRGTTNELRLRFRLSNFGRFDANFWDRSFRLSASNDVLAPTSDLNDIVPGNSLRYGIVTFRVPPRASKAVLRVLNGNATAEIPLDLSQTGRPAVDEQAEVADSLSQAIVLAVSRDSVPLIDSNDVNVTLVRARSRRFANTLRLTLSIRMMNRGQYPMHSGGVTMRVAADDAVLAPSEFPNLVVDPMSTNSADVVFDLPTSTTRIVLRTSIAAQAAELPFELR